MMKTAKHQAKSREILESAFRIWGRDFFHNRSLSDLAAVHGITKQALYRYFPSKEKLEQAMEDTAAEHYRRHAEALHRRLSPLHGDSFVQSFISESIAYIRGNRRYMGFLAHRHRYGRDEPGGEIRRSMVERFTALGRENAGIPAIGMRYLNAVIFIAVHRNPGRRQFSADRHEAWRSGFASNSFTALPDFSRLLADASRVDYAPFGEDPLIRAVFETVMEAAGSRVSLEKIAAKAGLTKSSLYNYWPSKQEMLSDVLGRQIAVFSRLFHEFSEAYENPADQLFSYLAFTAGFVRRTPEILNYIQRLMSFGIAMPPGGKGTDRQFARPLSDILSLGVLNLHTYTPGDFLALVNLAGVNEIKHHLAEGSAGIHIDQCLEDLYLLIAGGLNTIRRSIS